MRRREGLQINWFKLSNPRGVTLIELLVAVAILGIIIAMATTGVSFIQNQNMTATSRQLMADFQRIRQEAMTSGTPLVAGGAFDLNRGFGIRFVSNASYVTFEFIDSGATSYTYDDANEEYEETGQRVGGLRVKPTPKQLPGTVTVTRDGAGDPTGNVLLYDSHGMLRNGDWTLGGNVVYVLRIPNSSEQPRCVSIDPVRIREGAWNGAACIVS